MCRIQLSLALKDRLDVVLFFILFLRSRHVSMLDVLPLPLGDFQRCCLCKDDPTYSFIPAVPYGIGASVKRTAFVISFFPSCRRQEIMLVHLKRESS